MITNESTNFENDAQFARRHNDRLRREALENAKLRDEEIAQRKRDWENTPEHLKICEVCSLPLDEPTKAMIATNALARWYHPFCNSVNISPTVVQGLVSLLKETYEETEIPLDILRQVVEAFRNQKSVCAISRVQLAFPVAGDVQTPKFDGSLISSIDRYQLQRQYESEQRKRARQEELHSPVLDFDSEGKLRLVSKTVQRWREGLDDSEFAELVRVLNSELTPAFPVSRSGFSPVAVGSTSHRMIR